MEQVNRLAVLAVNSAPKRPGTHAQEADDKMPTRVQDIPTVQELMETLRRKRHANPSDFSLNQSQSDDQSPVIDSALGGAEEVRVEVDLDDVPAVWPEEMVAPHADQDQRLGPLTSMIADLRKAIDYFDSVTIAPDKEIHLQSLRTLLKLLQEVM